MAGTSKGSKKRKRGRAAQKIVEEEALFAAWSDLADDETPLSEAYEFPGYGLCKTVADLCRARKLFEEDFLRKVAAKVEREDLCGHFKNNRAFTPMLLPEVVRDGLLDRARGLSKSGSRARSLRGAGFDVASVRKLEDGLASQRGKRVPELVCNAIDTGKGVLFLLDNYIPKAGNMLLRMMQSKDGEKSKNALAVSGQSARSYILDLRVTRTDGSRLICDGAARKELLERRPAGDVFRASRVQEIVDDDRYWKFGRARKFPLSPMVAREAKINAGVPELGLRAGDLAAARAASRAAWVDRTEPARLTRMVMGSNIMSRSSSHADFRQRSMGVEVGPNLAAVERECRTVFQTVDTEFVLHLARLRKAIELESNVVADELKRFVAHVAQTPMIMHFEKGLQESFFADPAALLIALGPEMIEGYKHKKDVLTKALRRLKAAVKAVER